MALSKHEQELLDEMERRLYQSEADVVKPSVGRKLNLRSLVLGIVVAIVGVLSLLAGVTAQQPWLGIIGFLVMLGGALLAFGTSSQSGAGAESTSPQGGKAPRNVARESLSERAERRWDERMEGER